MGTSIVTVGGKVVYPAPDAARNRADSLRDPQTPDVEHRRLALFLGAAAAVGLLILLIACIAHRDRTER